MGIGHREENVIRVDVWVYLTLQLHTKHYLLHDLCLIDL